jgi:threonylcarbamoyladenosine tRNA methylthiotransferase MtaB
MQTIKFLTLGCKVNQYDTQVIREQFCAAGFTEIDNHLPADVCVINTCTVTHRADADSLSLIRRAKRENPSAEIVVTGCLTELDEEKIRKTENKSLVVKNKYKSDILQHFFSHYPRARQFLNSPTYTPAHPRIKTAISGFKGHTRTFIKIQDGCNYFCSYCKVPLVRGRSRSRPVEEVIDEARNLVKNGFKEIVLCGICLGAYGKDQRSQGDLIQVIEELEKIEGLLRVRLSSIEPGDISHALIDKMAESKKLCRHLHIPLQSGSDRILKKMNRNYKVDDYLSLVRKIKENVSLFALTTDVLVGFPGESQDDFQDTFQLIKDILPLKVHIFPYSIRRGTTTGSFKSEISPAVIKERISRLKEVADRCAFTYRKQFLNSTMNVLIEGRVKNYPGFCWGYTDNYLKVMVKSDLDLNNQFMAFKLKEIVKDHILAKEAPGLK